MIKKLCKNNKVTYNHKSSFPNTLVRVKSNVDCFYAEKQISPDDGKKCVCFRDPLIMLFNQERLSKIGKESVEKWLKSLEQLGSTSLDKLRSQCSDDDLCKMIKSRHLQQPCELIAWMDYMSANMDKFKEMYAAEMADREAEKSAALNDESNISE